MCEWRTFVHGRRLAPSSATAACAPVHHMQWARMVCVSTIDIQFSIQSQSSSHWVAPSFYTTPMHRTACCSATHRRHALPTGEGPPAPRSTAHRTNRTIMPGQISPRAFSLQRHCRSSLRRLPQPCHPPPPHALEPATHFEFAGHKQSRAPLLGVLNRTF